MKHSVLFYFLLIGAYNLNAQVPEDSLQRHEGEYDTVIVKERPHIITKPLVVEYATVAKFYFAGHLSAFNSLNYYAPCPGCEAYLAKHKSSNSPLLSMGAGAELMYASRKIIVSLGAEYISHREKFRYASENTLDGSPYRSVNNNRYVNLRLTGGYWLGRENKNISLIVSGGLVYGRLISTEGQEIDYDDPTRTRPLSDSIFRKNQWSVTVGSKIVLLPSKRLKLFLEPYYMGNITDAMKSPYMYLKLYNIIGARLGFMYSL